MTNVAVLAVTVAACGGATPASTTGSTPDNQPASSSTTGGGGTGSIDISSLGDPPVAGAQSAAAEVDGTSFVFDAADLGSQRCEVSSDRIAVNIGQSQDWFTFVATSSGGTWTAGPSFALEDGPQHEGLVEGSEIVVDGASVTFQGEVVVKQSLTDFDSWVHTVGSVSVNCASA